MRTRRTDRYQVKKLLSAIENADSILLFCHISADGDTIGSALALKMLFTRLQKHVVIVLDGVVPSQLFFLPDLFGFRKPGDVAAQVDVQARGTLAIAVDVSCVDRMGAAETVFFSAPVTAQIDHHQTNPAYATINVIDSDAPATAVVAARLWKALGLPIRREEAICLYTALSTDTGNFVYENTNAEAFLLMSRLMKAELPLARYSRLLFRQKEREFIALLGKALPTMAFLCNGAIAGMRLSRPALLEAGATNENTDGIVDYAIDTSGVRMAYFARETKEGSIKFSLRALSPCRVDEVAEAFGGGGHQLAAGCALDLPLEEAAKRMEEALVKAWEGKFHP